MYEKDIAPELLHRRGHSSELKKTCPDYFKSIYTCLIEDLHSEFS